MSSASSSTTGARSPNGKSEEKPTAVGTQLSGQGSTTSQPGGALSIAKMHPVALMRDPEANTAAILSSLQSLGVEVKIKRQMTFPTDPTTGESKGWREVVKGTEVALVEGANLAKAKETMAAAMAPATQADIELWIAELSIITAKRHTSEAGAELLLTAYGTRLAQYPGDIVRETLKGWSGKWFPTWGELKEILDGRTAERAAIRDAVAAIRPPNQMPAAFETMDRESQINWLRFEARIARRTDADRASELEAEADKLEAQEA